MPWEDDREDFDADEEWVEDGDSDDAEADLLMCPSCSRSVHEDTQQCPYCGDWITPVHPPTPWRRWVWAAAAILVIVSLIAVTVL